MATTDRETFLEWGFVATLVGGILLLAGGVLFLLLLVIFAFVGFGLAPPEVAGPLGFFFAFASVFAIASLVTGCATLLAAYSMRRQPEDAMRWGIVALVAGALALPVGGGFGLGAFAAIAGGILGILAAQKARVETRPLP